ncbi:TraB/GumN family protein [Sphingomonas alpina]|uniref:TraB/GumN family protein n=1 Tax=Sphingomonas alpina TaxID=653931 RepID=A0A7H0LEA4_9SPHN|nr:TraB/GumN family protein [Sphingomonas alpina]QNQ08007.1 TraB/GumN family protein [Sphingomonas alpina]
MKRFVAALIAATLSATSALAQTAPATPAQAQVATPASTVAKVEADPALWVVKDKDTTIYLFGTFHALKPNLDWFDGAVKTAFDASDQVVLELNMPEPAEAQKIVMPLAIDPSGKKLSDKIPEAKRAAYTAGMTKLGLPPAAVEQYDPWFVSIMLSQMAMQKAGFSAEDGTEAQLTKAAKASGKRLSGFETMTQQLGYFDTLPEAAQVVFLMSSIEEAEEFGPKLNEMLGYWSKGEDVKLGQMMNEDLKDSRALYDVLLKNRNQRWATVIADRMKQPGTVFVAVGAGHLAGPDSVQHQLARYGLKATRVLH